MDYSRYRDTSLQLGLALAWLLEPRWARAWADSGSTFCSSYHRNLHTLQHFITFTQVR